MTYADSVLAFFLSPGTVPGTSREEPTMNTTITALAQRYVIARADLATAETAYLDVAVAWHEAVEAGAASVAGLTAAAGIPAADGKAFRWLGAVVATADGNTPTLPHRGVVALEADIAAILKSGKGSTDSLTDLLAGLEDETLPTIAEAVATLAAKRRTKDTARRTGKATGKGKGKGEAPDPRSLDALLADTLALLARIDRVADTMTPEQAATLAVIGAGVESIATRAIVANA